VNADGTTEVTIRSEVEGASIAYTLEAGDDARWELYVGPIAVPDGAALRARAVRYGWAESEEVRGVGAQR
jgi:N-sulfoglucosamine sulfohydrolase